MPAYYPIKRLRAFDITRAYQLEFPASDGILFIRGEKQKRFKNREEERGGKPRPFSAYNGQKRQRSEV